MAKKQIIMNSIGVIHSPYPLLDIKPYVKYFDDREQVTCGWLEKHFKDGNIPNATIVK